MRITWRTLTVNGSRPSCLQAFLEAFDSSLKSRVTLYNRLTPILIVRMHLSFKVAATVFQCYAGGEKVLHYPMFNAPKFACEGQAGSRSRDSGLKCRDGASRGFFVTSLRRE